VLGVDQRAVSRDVEYAAAALDEIGLDAEIPGDCGRQTGGLGQITSAHTVIDDYAHRQAPRKAQ
jgi:hypothetical protein